MNIFAGYEKMNGVPDKIKEILQCTYWYGSVMLALMAAKDNSKFPMNHES